MISDNDNYFHVHFDIKAFNLIAKHHTQTQQSATGICFYSLGIHQSGALKT